MAGTLDIPARRPHPLLKIGQLAGLSGLSSRNLRFYADAGVLGDLPRSAKGYRLFPSEAIQWVRILRAPRPLGSPWRK